MVGRRATLQRSTATPIIQIFLKKRRIYGYLHFAFFFNSEVECQPPPKPENGYIVGKPPFKAGDIAQVECNQGFVLDGQPIIACQDNARWSRQNSKCIFSNKCLG